MGDSLSRVLVVDDDAEVREAYRSFFEAQDAFKLIGEEADAVHIVAVYEQQRPDVVLMDLQMPRVSGVEAIRELHARWPKACIVAMTTFGTRDYVVAALKAGASGYLLKDVGGAALLAALHQAMQGEMPLSSAVRRALVASVLDSEVVKTREHKLAPREVELVGWLARGLSNQHRSTDEPVGGLGQAIRGPCLGETQCFLEDPDHRSGHPDGHRGSDCAAACRTVKFSSREGQRLSFVVGE